MGSNYLHERVKLKFIKNSYKCSIEVAYMIKLLVVDVPT